MSPSPFRSAAVVCSIMTATLGVGVLTPVAASAATSSNSSSSPSSDIRPADSVNPDLDDIPINPSLQAPTFLSDSSTLHGARSFVGNAGQDAVWLLEGNTVRDHSPANSGLFRLIVQDRHEDADLEVIRVHTAADGTQTRTARIPMPRTIQIPGLRAQNKFTPGPRTFSGTATAGATVVAIDGKTGRTLFTTKAAGSGNGYGEWSAETDLAADTEYALGFTQTTTSGRTNSLLGIDFSPMSTVPPAPTVSATERRLNGSFALSGTVEEPAAAVVAEDEAGNTLGSAEVENGHFAVQVPQDHLGSTVYVVAETADHTPSERTAVRLEQLPTSSTVTKPILKDVFVYPNGDVQVVGKFDGATGRWILQGDRVLAGIPYSDGWSWTVKASDSGEQVDVANLGFDPDKGFSSLSERVALPRLLKVDGIAETNTYTPGEREFSGSAEAGATVTATDATGKELFSTKVSGSRSGVGTWKTTADLSSEDGYEVTFTQTTADGRKSIMRDIAFEASAAETPAAPIATAAFSEDVTAWAHVTGTASKDATVTVRDTDGTRVAETTADGEGRYDVAIDPSKVGYGEQTLSVTQTVDDLTSDRIDVTLDYGQNAPVIDPTERMSGTDLSFSGTGTDGALVQLIGNDFRNDTRIGETHVVGGKWTIDAPELTLPAGHYQFWARQWTRGGKVELVGTDTAITSAAPSAEGYFPANPAEWAGIAGMAQPGATVTVRDHEGEVIGRTPVETANGLYNVGIDPNRVGSGKQHFTVSQTVNGVESDRTAEVTLDYGANEVAFTSPSEGSTISDLTFTGTGRDGSTVTLAGTDFATDRSIGSATVADGAWTIENSDITLPAGRYQFWAAQRTPGGKISFVGTNIDIEH